MSKVCQITGRKAAVGNNVSHSKRRTKRKFKANLFNRRFFWVEQQIWISLTVSAAGLRTINKLGLDAAIRQAAEKGYLTSNRVQVILECTEMKDSGMPGTSRYITTKNRKNTTERLELKKYNPILKRVTVHKEIK